MIINGNLDLSSSYIESLGKIKEVNGYLWLAKCSKLRLPGNLQVINGNLSLMLCTSLRDLGNLKQISSVSIFIYGSKITEEYIKKEKPFLLNKCKFTIV